MSLTPDATRSAGDVRARTTDSFDTTIGGVGRDMASCIGMTVADLDDHRIGELVDVYADDDTGRPEWLAVKTGWFGSKISFVPMRGAHVRDDRLQVDWEKDVVKGAPRCEADGHLSEAEERDLYEYYGLNYSTARSETQMPGSPTAEPQGAVMRGGRYETRADRSTDDAMTRSEQEIDVQKSSHEAGRARLRKWVETDHVQFTVPVRKEKARLVSEPVTDANRDRAMDGPEITENEHEVVLREEEVDVAKRTVPKERVRLEKEAVTEERPVEADLAKEHIEAEGDIDRNRSKRR